MAASSDELSLTVHPFFAEDAALPSPLPLLTAQTDLLYFILPAHPLLVQEEMQSYKSRIRRIHTPRQSTPYPKSAHRPRFASRDNTSPLSDLSENDDCVVPPKGCIPKPTGEAGRPGRGGYNLEAVLGWKPDVFSRLKVSFIL